MRTDGICLTPSLSVKYFLPKIEHCAFVVQKFNWSSLPTESVVFC